MNELIICPQIKRLFSFDFFLNLKGNLEAGEGRGKFGAVILSIETRCGLDVPSRIGEDVK